ncbi:hypothetical protein AYI68_g1609 [Smittium mucronatum]|uniref:Uncharacterized protein n=1 Tax=Smittium mucronatum TaxID=133383 RepID=A0A1R0H4T0_9FUNG|nr:hypothetical protein AYI68_g1609 [Smittium mucronatum]
MKEKLQPKKEKNQQKAQREGNSDNKEALLAHQKEKRPQTQDLKANNGKPIPPKNDKGSLQKKRKLPPKPILMNPFVQDFPEISISTLEEIEKNLKIKKDANKALENKFITSESEKSTSKNKRLKGPALIQFQDSGNKAPESSLESFKESELDPVQCPQSKDSLVLGINNTTKALEELLNRLNEHTTSRNKPSKSTSGSEIAEQADQSSKAYSNKDSATPLAIEVEQDISAIFVCSEDVEPKHMISHLAGLVNLVNARKISCSEAGSCTPTLYISLPAGSEQMVSKLVGLKRTSCFAIKPSPISDDFIRFLISQMSDFINYSKLVSGQSAFASLRPMAIKYLHK